MRYDGYYLSGYTTKVLLYVASDTDCWESCLQETSFICLTLADATRGNRTCLLYDTKALFHYADRPSAAEMTTVGMVIQWVLNGFQMWVCFEKRLTKMNKK